MFWACLALGYPGFPRDAEPGKYILTLDQISSLGTLYVCMGVVGLAVVILLDALVDDDTSWTPWADTPLWVPIVAHPVQAVIVAYTAYLAVNFFLPCEEMYKSALVLWGSVGLGVVLGVWTTAASVLYLRGEVGREERYDRDSQLYADAKEFARRDIDSMP